MNFLTLFFRKFSIFFSLILMTLSLPVLASDYPSKPVTIIAHTGAGSSTDIFARELAKASEPFLGTPIVVVNRPGGGGATQMALIKSAKPDGYTVGVNTTTHLTAMQTNLKNVYKISDFDWIMLNQIDPYVIAVSNDSPYKSIDDLVKATQQGKNLKVGGYGTTGSAHDIAFTMLAKTANIDFTWIAYPGGQQAMTALLGNHLDAVNTNPGPALQFAEAGRIRILGVLAPERLSTFPDVLTYSEQGFDVDTQWAQIRGIYGPKGIPNNIKQTLANAFSKGMQTQEFQSYLKQTAQQTGDLGPTEYPAFIHEQSEIGEQWLQKLGISQ